MNTIESCLSSEDNDILLRPFSRLEFSSSLGEMYADRSLGYDGFSPPFFKTSWELCSDEIFNACCFWLDKGFFPATINDTNIVLIPKNNKSESMKDRRPISLCNVVYKVLAKVLANRLKLILHKCVSSVQSAFIPGRSILDNGMVATEIIHYMKSKTKESWGIWL